MKSRAIFKILIVIFLLLLVSARGAYLMQSRLVSFYHQRESETVRDREGKKVALLPNKEGYFAVYTDRVPPHLKQLLLLKEDRFFYRHPGINPGSIFKRILSYVGIGNRQGSSTITQQLVKVLLKKERDRSLKNKLLEAFYALSLEAFKSKDEILNMYVNSLYLGNQAQGFSEASHLYFNLPPELLTKGQILQLLATTSRPSERNPALAQNEELSRSLAGSLGLSPEEIETTSYRQVRENMARHSRSQDSHFEIKPLVAGAGTDLTLDLSMNRKIREIVKRNLDSLSSQDVGNASVMVIKIPENEILALVGSPDPNSIRKGSSINMLFEPRPIGSTVKPFIYLQGFKKGLRPYTLVSDREYKYITAIGFPLYPKNFDYRYRGEVTLHYALSNSLNVPSVKVLEFVGLSEFYQFLTQGLGFEPIQPLDNYQLGIALGALEMDLYHLCSYFTIFPQEGILKEVTIQKQEEQDAKRVADPSYVQLVNRILSDRKTGVEQFGLASDLNLSQDNYALKTGTSRDFRDSWVVGYTPDFLVGVWVGNADNSPTKDVSGQEGAGKIWGEVMELLLNSSYNQETTFDFSALKEFQKGESLEYGLPGDEYEKHRTLITKEDQDLILYPHPEDIFLLEDETKIILEAKETSDWFVNGDLVGRGKKSLFRPTETGPYTIEARAGQRSQKIRIFLRGD